MSDTETITDAEIVPHEGNGTALVPAPAQPATLFRTDDPVESVERMTAVANALKAILVQQGLTARIQGKDHVLVEGWTTCGALVGVTPVPVWTRPLDGEAVKGKVFGYEARVEARTLDGRVIGAAEAMCTRTESRWKSADDYAIRSMAQTRATSKALRGPLGFIVTLAGFESTPAEEMPHDAAPVTAPAGNGARATATPPGDQERKASARQKGYLNGLAERKGWSYADYANAIMAASGAQAQEFSGEEHARSFLNKLMGRLPGEVCSQMIEQLKAELGE